MNKGGNNIYSVFMKNEYCKMSKIAFIITATYSWRSIHVKFIPYLCYTT